MASGECVGGGGGLRAVGRSQGSIAPSPRAQYNKEPFMFSLSVSLMSHFRPLPRTISAYTLWTLLLLPGDIRPWFSYSLSSLYFGPV
jgi:hypothetical protein